MGPRRAPWHGVRRSLCLVAFFAVLAAPAWAGTTVSVGSDPSKAVIKGELVTPDQVLPGEVVIENDTITCAAAQCSEPAGATHVTVTGGYIFPGFIDAHNHVAYNVFPKWHPPLCQYA